MRQREVKRQLTRTLAPLMVLMAAQARFRELWAEALAFYLLYGAKGDKNPGGEEGLNNGGAGTRERCDHSLDHEGSTNVITDSSGNIVWDGDYEAFGSVARSNGTLAFDASYTGKEFDTDTGLYYYNARFYDPELGRFITEDPARDGGNWFAYCGNNPMSRIDPTGLQIGDIPAQYTMQQGAGLLAPDQPISRKGCVVTAWARIVNAINGNNSVGFNSFGYTTTGVGENNMANWGSNSMYVNSKGDLNTADFVAAKTGWAVEKTDKNLAEILSALESLKVAVYVTGSGNLVDGNGNHTVNITGVPGENGLIPTRGTSDYDSTQPMPRNYSLGPSNAVTNTTQITGLTYTLPASQQKAFNDALKSEIAKTQQQQAQRVEQ